MNSWKALAIIGSFWFFLMAAVPAFSQVAANRVLVSLENGKGLMVDSKFDVRSVLSAGPATGVEIAEEFFRICVQTPANKPAFLTAANSSAWKLIAGSTNLEATSNAKEGKFDYLANEYAMISFWDGNVDIFEGRDSGFAFREQTLRRSINAKQIKSPQCNFDVSTFKMTNYAASLISRLNELLGTEIDQLGGRWGYLKGYWDYKLHGKNYRIHIVANDLRLDDQHVHLVFQPA